VLPRRAARTRSDAPNGKLVLPRSIRSRAGASSFGVGGGLECRGNRRTNGTAFQNPLQADGAERIEAMKEIWTKDQGRISRRSSSIFPTDDDMAKKPSSSETLSADYPLAARLSPRGSTVPIRYGRRLGCRLLVGRPTATSTSTYQVQAAGLAAGSPGRLSPDAAWADHSVRRYAGCRSAQAAIGNMGSIRSGWSPPVNTGAGRRKEGGKPYTVLDAWAELITPRQTPSHRGVRCRITWKRGHAIFSGQEHKRVEPSAIAHRATIV